jgi:RNA polymerase sigma-70 factor (ECF subfamily)
VDPSRIQVERRAHFFGATKMMRQILLDNACLRSAAKRGGDAVRVDLDAVAELVPGEESDRQLIAFDGALEELARVEERRARRVEMPYFGGLSVEETAAVRRVPPSTAMRDRKIARAAHGFEACQFSSPDFATETKADGNGETDTEVSRAIPRPAGATAR